MMSQEPGYGRPRDDVTLRELRSEFPDLHISTDFYGRYRAGVARGQNGHPWLVMSTDTGRFRAALRHPPCRGTFRSVTELTTAIGALIDAYNDRCHPVLLDQRRR